jgi:signal transduction histidine kinase
VNVKRLSWYTATSAAVASIALAAVSFAFAFANRDLPIGDVAPDSTRLMSVQSGIAAPMWALSGWFLATRRPAIIFGWVMLAAGLGHGLAGTGWGYAVASEIGGRALFAPWAGLWLATWAGALELVATAVILVMYPSGRFPRRFAGALGALGLASVALGVLASMVQEMGYGANASTAFGRLENPLELAFVGSYPGIFLFAPAMTLLTLMPIVRWLRSNGEERQALRWLAVLLIVWFPINLGIIAFDDSNYSQLIIKIPTLVMIAAVVTATLRYRIHGIEAVAGRAYLYAALLAIFAAVYGVVIGIASLAPGDVGQSDSFLAASVAALALMPAASRVQRGINRFLFGDRDDPYAAISRTGARLEAAGSGEELLPELAAAVSSVLRVPYVAIDLYERGGHRRVDHGLVGERVSEYPLVHDGARIGALIVGHRVGERGFSTAEARLLGDLARQASAAAANFVLTEELRRSRERIVSAREEERRRLRRDLHDGLGPVLTGGGMLIDAARNTLLDDPTAAHSLLNDARKQVGTAVDDIRRLVYALRPPALDELGLVGALREMHAQGPISVTISADEPFPELPAAVEVAAFRIITEAVNNALRHAKATRCSVRLHVNGALELEVLDDGLSVDHWRPGVGLTSMRERAAELGGTCEAGPDEQRRGRVLASIPLGGNE